MLCMKSVHIRRFLVRIFPHFQTKIRTKNSPNTDTFYAVMVSVNFTISPMK